MPIPRFESTNTAGEATCNLCSPNCLTCSNDKGFNDCETCSIGGELKVLTKADDSEVSVCARELYTSATLDNNYSTLTITMPNDVFINYNSNLNAPPTSEL